MISQPDATNAPEPAEGFDYTAIITFWGDGEPYTASFDDLAALGRIAQAAREHAQDSIRTVIVESNL